MCIVCSGCVWFSPHLSRTGYELCLKVYCSTISEKWTRDELVERWQEATVQLIVSLKQSYFCICVQAVRGKLRELTVKQP